MNAPYFAYVFLLQEGKINYFQLELISLKTA